MKKKIKYQVNNESVEREVNYIPIRYIIAILIMVDTIEKSILITKENLKTNLLSRFIRALVRIFSPML